MNFQGLVSTTWVHLYFHGFFSIRELMSFMGMAFSFIFFFFFFHVDDMFGERKMTRFMFSSPLLEDVMGDNVNRTRYDMNELETIFLQTLSFSRRIKVLEHKQ